METPEKKLPPARFDLLFPPIAESEHFRYFEGAAAHPFRASSRGFELVNAWWLAEVSLLAYAPSDFAIERFRRAGLEVAGGAAVEAGSGQCYIAHDDKAVIVAFRGTEVLRPDLWALPRDAWRNFAGAAGDTRTDAKFALVELAPGSGRFVHRGFLHALGELWPAVEAHVSRLVQESPARTLWLTGHSLGAALATLAAERLPGVRGLYTFGSPKVGDAAFAEGFRTPCYRFVNNRDIVPWLPPVGPYAPPRLGVGRYVRVGVLKHIDAHGRLVDGPSRLAQFRDWLSDVQHRAVEAAREVIAGHPWALAPDALNDHSPLRYAVLVWNLYARSQGNG
jgi:triacylglycerol lipase